MKLRDRLYELKTSSHVELFLEKYSTGAFFKGGFCHQTSQGFGYAEQALDGYGNIPMGFLCAIPGDADSQAAAEAIAQSMGVPHHVPQLILFSDHKSLYDADGLSISTKVIGKVLLKAFGPAARSVPPTASAVAYSCYQTILENILKGSLSAGEAEQQWTQALSSDNTLRTIKEWALLRSLFGEAESPYALMAHTPEELLQHRAKQLQTGTAGGSTSDIAFFWEYGTMAEREFIDK